MLNEKRIKILIIAALFLIEALVWTFNDPGRLWSLGFSDGTESPNPIVSEQDEPDSGDQNVTDGDEEDEEHDIGIGEQEEEPEGGNSPSDTEDSADKPGDGTSESLEPMTLEESEVQGMLILVNKTHPLDRTYKPDDLEKIKYYAPDRSKAGRYLRAEAADAFHKMVEKASEEGIELKMTTAYRSYDFQKLLYDNYVKKEGEAAANRYSAKPGQSEHQTGLAADVSSPSVDYQLTQEYGETNEGKWLAAHAHEFGFIIRYPKDKEDITGYLYEPWHVRYVGISAAAEIYEKDLTLEEYLNILR